MKTKLFYILLVLGIFLGNAQVGIGTTTPDASSILDITSTSEGVLIPRMTTAERDAIATPAEGLQVFNTTKKSLDIFVNGLWKSYSYPINSNLVYVYSVDDLPSPNSGEILLETNKMYVFSGAVNIGSNYIEINGAGLRGTDPRKDQVISEISSGAVLRSLTDNGVNNGVYIKELAVKPANGAQAYNFIDATTGGDGIGTNFVNIFSGSSVVGGVGSVGQIKGYRAITIIENLWDASGGLKVGGKIGKLTLSLNNIVGVSGATVELNGDLDALDLDFSNNYFVDPGNLVTGDIGLKVNTGAIVGRGRLSTNLFRNVTTLDGITSSDIGWNMVNNSSIPDSKANGFVFFNNTISNPTTTGFANEGVFVKIAGTTTAEIENKFTAGNNRLTYKGRRPVSVSINASIDALIPEKDLSYSIAIAKNGSDPTGTPTNTIYVEEKKGPNKQKSFQLALNTSIELEKGDFIEVFVRSNIGTDALEIIGFQFNVAQ